MWQVIKESKYLIAYGIVVIFFGSYAIYLLQ